MKKSVRQELIANLILENEISTQDDLAKAIKIATGVDVTQATISRDIKELALIKIAGETTNFKYSLPQTNLSDGSHRLKNLIQSSLLEIKTREGIVVIRTIPGSALALKRLIREQFSEDIFSIFADDDSILITLEAGIESITWIAYLK
ncbi:MULTISPECIES: ArgR family transcriptional regulator [unclassified Enterococcus]|uniref:arginine repressor n=1 Tax=unclassified Enterococcus TaxID=2608891 RepID=UPI00155196D3|nr:MULTISPECIES: ArgR family transcriptional regulator [unclassified Enterococcus]MBS7575990.1 ArgR family transcriptional regulator [Enterococcus sp. MMGLQ5-2]MBS7583223.1 ArgR family transcriptional regulator [Enterococcus sp. MMGLQ5-1]NPD11083.1 ArgR family transcriptional regulator [Enterococcus sp. MMGLQ5-1]NPD35826.1 ArgR family transcriptional regulator [Enterococcus sp. MMGLQ5-2]